MKIELKTILILAFPVLILLGFAARQEYTLRHGQEVILEITGFDPRDFFAGHFLTYKIKYTDPKKVPEAPENSRRTTWEPECPDEVAYWCKDTRTITEKKPEGCSLVIKGVCDYGLFSDNTGRFLAGVEKMYIPEKYASRLAGAVHDNQGKIVLMVSSDGHAVIKDLLINDIQWQDYMERMHID